MKKDNTKNRVLTAIDIFKKRGYWQVSATELAHTCKVPTRAVTIALHKLHYRTLIRHGELYVHLVESRFAPSLVEAQPQPVANFSHLQLPKSAILNEVSES